MTEVELCQIVIKWLQVQRWEIYQEVQLFNGGARADIVAVRKPCIWIIEAKTSMSLSLLAQADAWRGYANYVSIAVPRPRRHRRDGRLLALLGLGKIEIDEQSKAVDYYRFGQFVRMRPYMRERILGGLRPEQKTGEFADAGTNTGGHWTPYKGTMNQVRVFLKEHGPATIKEIIENLQEHHYSSDKSALQSMRKALGCWEDWCHTDTSHKEYIYSVREMPR